MNQKDFIDIVHEYVGYKDWLYNKAGAVHNGITYLNLFDAMYTTEFTWIISRDSNRAEKGKNLRYQYSDEFVNKKTAPASFLEVFVCLADDFDTTTSTDQNVDRTYKFFWLMLKNMGFEPYDDLHWDEKTREKVGEIMRFVMNREYDETGKDGPFPLKNPRKDQRTVELWYQFNAYLIENDEELYKKWKVH